MNTFDRLVTLALFAIAAASCLVVNASINELAEFNANNGRGVASASIARK